MEVVGPPKHVERASVLHAAMDVEVDPNKSDAHDEDLQRRLRNLNNPLSKREPGLEDKIDEELKPARTGNQRIDQKEKAALLQARSKSGPPIGSGLSSTGACSSNQVPPQGT